MTDKPEQTTPKRAHMKGKTAVTLAICLIVALLFFVTGPNYSGPFPVFVNSYLLDLLLPFALYLLLSLFEAPLFRDWFIKAILIFSLGAFVELAQYLEVPLLGSTFDPWDFAFYAAGIALAIFCDADLFPKLFSFWRPEETET